MRLKTFTLFLVIVVFLVSLSLVLLNLLNKGGGVFLGAILSSENKMPFEPAKFKEALTAIRERIDGTGVYDLPMDFKDITIDGSMYVTYLSEKEVLYVFPIWRAKGSNFEGYLYYTVNGIANNNLHNLQTIEIAGPEFAGEYRRTIDVNTLDEVSKIDGNGWYEIKWLWD
jgi:hypothetical protein